jgi:AraC-like DNA-binding protein
LFPHGSGHTLGDTPDTPAVEFETLLAGLAPGEAIEFPSGTGGATTVLLCGSYSFSAEGDNPLLRGLPSLLHVAGQQTRGTGLDAAIALLAAEAQNRNSGTAMVVDRLVDLIFVYTLRTWLEEQRRSQSFSWFGALQNPQVAPALRAIHDDPAHPWTVAALASAANLSRAVFARRFADAVGEAPLSYVTRWRMTVAASLLERGHRIAAVAPRVGYESEFAFAKAFKRVRNIAPGQLRTANRNTLSRRLG